jgi:hypothetical protein
VAEPLAASKRDDTREPSWPKESHPAQLIVEDGEFAVLRRSDVDRQPKFTRTITFTAEYDLWLTPVRPECDDLLVGCAHNTGNIRKKRPA